MGAPLMFVSALPLRTGAAPSLSPRGAHCARQARPPAAAPRRLRRCAAAAPRASAAAPVAASSLFRLQNGSDVRGVALSLPPANQEVTLTPEHAREIAAAFVRLVRGRRGGDGVLRIAVGRDSRLSGKVLAAAVAEGAAAEGAEITDFGMATTPAMFMCTVLEGWEFDCAVMLTASHLPPDRNGLKFFTSEGSANKGDVKAMLEGAARAVEGRGGFLSGGIGVDVERKEFIPVYAAHLVKLIREGCAHPTDYERPLNGFRVVVDAGNGAAGFFAGMVLKPLGADVRGQFLEPDGTFPNHVPNPEDKLAMQMTQDATVACGADLGVIFDTDVDRSGVVDKEGRGINRNALIALLARIVLREYPGSTIVTDSVTSNGLKRFIEKLGGKHYRYRKGYKNVIDKGIELNDDGVETQLAIETSGHGAMKENYFLDDGAYLAVKIIIEMVRMRLAGDERGIGGLLDGLQTPREEHEFRLEFRDRDGFQEYGKRCVQAFAEFAATVDGWTVEEVNHEGYRVSVDEGNGNEGWLLLRQSLHDPLLPLNIESEVDGGIVRIASVLVDQFLPKWDNVDPSSLADFSK